MPGMPKPPEGIPGEGQNNTTTGWDALREDPAGIEEEVQEAPETPVGTDGSAEVTPEPSEPETYSGPLNKAPVFDWGYDSAPSGLFFSDVVAIAKKAIEQKSKTSEENPAILVIFGGVCVPVYKDSDPEKLEAAWARVVRGHGDQQIKVPDPYDNHPGMAETYPLVIKTLDDIPKEVLAAEARADEALRKDGDAGIQRADALINREEKLKRLKEELWDVEIKFGIKGMGNPLLPNIFDDRENPLLTQFETMFEAKGVMYNSYTYLWAKLMQQRLNDDESATIEDIAEEMLDILDIKVSGQDRLFNAVTDRLLPISERNWEHREALARWYEELLRRQGWPHPSPPKN